MKRISLLGGSLLGGFTALVVAALSELGSLLFGLPGIPFSIFDWMTRHLPGEIISLFIGTMVALISRLKLGPTAAVAKQIEQASAFVIFIAIGLIFGLILTALARRRPEQVVSYGVTGGVILLILMFIIQVSLGFPGTDPMLGAIWLGFLLLGWGWVLGRLIQYLAAPLTPGVPADPSRRQFLYLVGIGSFTILVSSVGISLASNSKSIPNTGPGSADGADAIANAATTSGPAQSPPRAALAARFKPVPGTRPELTANSNFYRIDINTIPPSVDAAKWHMKLSGLVDHPAQFSLDQLRARPTVSQAVTLECISNEVGGDLTSTSLWTGVRLKDILNESGLKPGAQEVYITAADGFYESVPIAEALDERTLLVYQMNGQPLAIEHGFPLRIYIPNHFGMKQPKWINTLEVIDHHAPGYWVDRGWSNEAIPPITSVIDAVAADAYDPQTGLIPVGGIAYAGARGISKVEVQVDNGPWLPAELRTPPLSPLTWVQWRYLWKAQIGQHRFQVRAYDGTGKPQITASAPPAPDGATGIHSTSAFIPQGDKTSTKP